MTLSIINCLQGSPEWRLARCGIPTASEFSTCLASGKGGGPSKTRRTYMLKLLGERITGEPAESYTNHHMLRGNMMEEEARSMYALLEDVEPVTVGFVRNDRVGASPDSLIGESGLLEIKTNLPHIILDLIFSDDKFPTEHIAQIQGQMWVTEREWCDLICYWPKLKPFVKRVYRDEAYIKSLASGVFKFCDELDELEEKYGDIE